MTSITGNKGRAFTLIEIMVTTAVFSLSVLFIFEAYFRSMGILNYCENYFRAAWLADERMWRAQNELARSGALVDLPSDEILEIGVKKFGWSLSYGPIEDSDKISIYRIDSILSWTEGSKSGGINRTAYAIYGHKKG